MVTTPLAREAAVTSAGNLPLTLGVEEEFLLVDPVDGVNLPVGDEVIGALPAALRGQARHELRRSMMEMVTPVCTDLPTLRAHLLRHRRAAGEAASAAGARLVAVGATPVGDPHRAVPEQQRYHAMAEHYGPVATDAGVCGCHIHVGVPDPDLAIEVCNRLRVWLPVVQALTANSPVYAGRDTGQASWRSVQLQRWPGVGPTPHFDSRLDYDRTVAALVRSQVMLDEAMVYWYARPSTTYPTVEVRVSDVCTDVDDTVLVAALVRALVATAVTEAYAGVPVPRTPDSVVAAAHWHAAHSGLDGTLTDLRRGATRPAWELVGDLFSTVEDTLRRHGDLGFVRAELSRLRRVGNGATRQRRTLRRTGSLPALLHELAERTVSG
ncbi:glutamate--cysteine ligase [Micromonospora sp. C28ISP2-4]|uniref:carboxylate-amine ligase n=1 Tax=Micromonospora sp. C28ISP2-4 TaxID=3059523 RepID=UPI002674B3A2|nr:glutamate--cysteine ligase [Micromonospora sp. C28ISP2-4]MDO3683293.1 glutamate--cysteine ligase [Micromonospora sp. C28ISP2-4]